jgi:methylglutaconyl-CoA hydratase
MKSDEPVLLTRDARGIATVTLNRPEKRNAFDDALIRVLHSIINSIANDPTIRAVILTGAGNVFSAGADLAHMRKLGVMGQQENFEDALRFADCLQALNRLPQPIIARVNGGAYGGGVGLIACADIAIGVSGAKFALTEVKFGIVPAVISPYVVAAIGERQARRWFLTAMSIDAQNANEMGLLHEVVEPTELDIVIERYIEMLLQGGPRAQSAAKKLVRDVQLLSDSELPRHTGTLLAELRSSTEGKEGLGAFLENRKPEWAKGS